MNRDKGIILQHIWGVAVDLWIRFGYTCHRFFGWSPRCIRVYPAKRLKIGFKYFVDVGTAERLVSGGAAVFRGPGTIIIQYTTKYLRPKVYERDGYRCVYCGHSDVPLSLDHVVPRSKGGLTVPSNLVTACIPCNRAKGNRDLEDFIGS